ncbi:MAG TPA: hypothetical protein VNJ08_00915 [Bacteriovoracaceae bacterium]|nr:hypothetical protein [Bacteriovoracaceae bacterium]
MLIVQKFHSIHEIDPEFIANIETLLQEDVANFDALVQRHDQAPSTDVFTYFLFFGPTQNAPIGFAQLSLRQIPWRNYLPWWRRLMFWKKDHLHWKQVTWQLGDGSHGLYVMDSKFARTGKEKIHELIKEYEARPDIQAAGIFCIKGLQDFQVSWDTGTKTMKEVYVLEPLTKAFKSYQDYLASLDPEIRGQIKAAWKTLHINETIKLGDYPTPAEAPTALPIEPDLLKVWAKWGAQVLTFENGGTILGCLLVLRGRSGNIFFEPFLFEPEGSPLVSEELYTQYALLKFFEMPDARKCHLMRFGAKLVFEEKADLLFFQDQGFQLKTITQSFHSRLKGLDRPV